jgi:site-specific DNA-methyltransferase (cytosine-N4-specific)
MMPPRFVFRQDPAYHTELGSAFCGDARQLLAQLPDNSVHLAITSPPFALQRQKEYGNKEQHEYIDWLTDFAALVHAKLRHDGSFVLDLGGAYQRGVPARSLYNFRIPIRFCDDLGFFLAQDFYWHNPSKLPSPIEWVNKRKIRAKDSVNNVWWFSKTEWPKADVSKVLAPYSARMTKLLKDPDAFYKPKVRPSGHDIGKAFGKDNGGAIPSNLLQIPNSESNGQYLAGCKMVGVKQHPARFPAKLPEFFVRFLTDPGDVVLDFFAGSNTTGAVAEAEGRRWLAFEERLDYVATSVFRFLGKDCQAEDMRRAHDLVAAGATLPVANYLRQAELLPVNSRHTEQPVHTAA